MIFHHRNLNVCLSLMVVASLTSCTYLIPADPSAPRYNTVVGERHRPEQNGASAGPVSTPAPTTTPATGPRSELTPPAPLPPAEPAVVTPVAVNTLPPAVVANNALPPLPPVDNSVAVQAQRELAASTPVVAIPTPAAPIVPTTPMRKVPVENTTYVMADNANIPSISAVPPRPVMTGDQSVQSQLSATQKELEQTRGQAALAKDQLSRDSAAEPSLQVVPAPAVAPMPVAVTPPAPAVAPSAPTKTVNVPNFQGVRSMPVMATPTPVAPMVTAPPPLPAPTPAAVAPSLPSVALPTTPQVTAPVVAPPVAPTKPAIAPVPSFLPPPPAPQKPSQSFAPAAQPAIVAAPSSSEIVTKPLPPIQLVPPSSQASISIPPALPTGSFVVAPVVASAPVTTAMNSGFDPLASANAASAPGGASYTHSSFLPDSRYANRR